MTSQEIFGFRLRLHRERARLSIAAIAAATRINPAMFEALEQSDLSAWPRGLYARNFVSAYATMVGLDPADTVDEFCRLFPHGDRRARETFREFAAIVTHPSAYREEVREPDRRRRSTPYVDPLPAFPWRVVRAALAVWGAGRARPAIQSSGPYSARRATL